MIPADLNAWSGTTQPRPEATAWFFTLGSDSLDRGALVIQAKHNLSHIVILVW
jgi:hypothetical protein